MLFSLFLLLINPDQIQPQSLMPELVGEWQVEYQLHPGPMGKGGKGQGKMIATKGPGTSLLMDFRCTSGPMQGFTLVQILLWNSRAEQFEMVWVDAFSPGLSGVKYGKVDGNQVVYAYKTKMGDRSIYHKSVVTYVSKDLFRAKSAMSMDGQTFQPSMELSYRRK